MLECILRAFCFIFPLKFGCCVVGVYQLVFWVPLVWPVLAADCHGGEVRGLVLCSAPAAGLVSGLGSVALLYGLSRDSPAWSLVVSLWAQGAALLYSLVVCYVLVLGLKLEDEACPSQYWSGARCLALVSWQYYSLATVHSYYVQLEMSDPPAA